VLAVKQKLHKNSAVDFSALHQVTQTQEEVTPFERDDVATTKWRREAQSSIYKTYRMKERTAKTQAWTRIQATKICEELQ
jgi:hypothetical protein